jgi:ribosome-associated protein
MWDLEGSSVVTNEARSRLREKLAGRLDAAGMVRVVASNHRSQLQNRQEAERRLVVLIRRALHVPKARRATRPGRSAVERRLAEKKLQGAKKRERRLSLDE